MPTVSFMISAPTVHSNLGPCNQRTEVPPKPTPNSARSPGTWHMKDAFLVWELGCLVKGFRVEGLSIFVHLRLRRTI